MSKTKNSIEELKKKLFIPLTNYDLENYIGANKIVKYSDIDEMKHIDELLPNAIDFRVVLYETLRNSGHWIVIVRNDDRGEYIFFDSYGNKLGSHSKFNTAEKNRLLGNKMHALKDLLKTRKKGMKVVSNTNRLQTLQSGSETCGRWVILFLKMYLDRGLNLQQFEEMIDSVKAKKSFENRDMVSCFFI